MIFFSWLFLYKPLIIHFCLTLCYTKSFWLPTNINRRLFSYYICLLSQNVHLSFPLSEFLMYIWKVTKTVTSHVLHTLTTGIIKTYLYKNTFDFECWQCIAKTSRVAKSGWLPETCVMIIQYKHNILHYIV